MLSKKTMKIISIIIMVVMAVMMVSSVVLAEPITDPKTLIPEAETSDATTSINTFGGKFYGIFAAIGATVAVIILVWLGIKYIMSSPDGKADIKKQALGYILGAALVFGASTILPLIISFITEALPKAA